MRHQRVVRVNWLWTLAAPLVVCGVVGAAPGCTADQPRPAEESQTGTAHEPTVHRPAPHLARQGPITWMSSAEARAQVATLRQQFVGAIPTGSGVRFGQEGDHIRALAFRSPPRALPAVVTLPNVATGAVQLRDQGSGLAVAFSLQGASPVAASLADDLVWYPGAGPSGADALLRVHPAGVEDYLHFAQRPEREQVRYHVALEGVAGLRLVERTLEFLDATGSPRLRVAPPYLVDAAGSRTDATIAVDGCAFDTSPRGPWGRAITAPGATDCTVAVSWQGAGVSYPAVLDPAWVATTNSMIVARTAHTATNITPDGAASQVLLAGGFNTAGEALDSAELYEPLSRTFAATDGMEFDRGDHTATALSSLVPLPEVAVPVLVAGGTTDEGGGTPRNTLEVYDPDTGLFATDTNTLAQARFSHAATLIGDAQVLLMGGYGPPLNQPTASATVYTLLSIDPLSSQLDATGSMNIARAAPSAVRLLTDEVLVAGGFVLSGAALQSAEVYTPDPVPANGAFAYVQPVGAAGANMSALRGYHTATLLQSGQVLLAGGKNQVAGGVYSNTVDIFHDGVQNPSIQGFENQPTPISMWEARAKHTATLLPTGAVAVIGGMNPTVLDSVEAFDPATMAFLAVSTGGMTARRNHTASLVNAGEGVAAGRAVVIAGGRDNVHDALAAAEVWLKVNGESCTLDQECLSGICTENVCCDVECDEDCFSCTMAGKGSGQDGECGFAQVGTPLPPQCVDEVEIHNACDGAGHAEQVEAIDCKPSTCAADNMSCSKFCDDDHPCSDKGWCYTGGAGGGGGGGAGGAGGGIPPGSGQCQPKRDIGEPCTDDIECTNPFCVDGHCCNLACLSQCQACDNQGSVGVCSNVGSPTTPEQPHINFTGEADEQRDMCAGMGTVCSGWCTGASDTECIYPESDVEDGDPTCSCDAAGCVEQHLLCNGDGTSLANPKSCEGMICEDDHFCKGSCASDDDCIEDYICDDTSQCVELTEPSCDGDHTVRIPDAEDEDCTPYRCDGQACRTSCQSVEHCVEPAVCNAAGQCVTQLAAPEVESCSCRVVGGTSRQAGGRAGSAGWLVLATLLPLAAARRRRARRPS